MTVQENKIKVNLTQEQRSKIPKENKIMTKLSLFLEGKVDLALGNQPI